MAANDSVVKVVPLNGGFEKTRIFAELLEDHGDLTCICRDLRLLLEVSELKGRLHVEVWAEHPEGQKLKYSNPLGEHRPSQKRPKKFL